MINNKKIAIIGAGNVGKTVALELTKQGNNVCVLSDVVGSQFTDLGAPYPFLITRLPEIPEPYIDTTKPYFNYKKHKQTCDKKRKARKKKKRR
jgi:choline dehydrogenase-like flavoprotein